jgi:hypothetical protein
VCCWRELLKASFLQHVTNTEPPGAIWERYLQLVSSMSTKKRGAEDQPEVNCLCAKKAVAILPMTAASKCLVGPQCLTERSKFAIVELQIEYPDEDAPPRIDDLRRVKGQWLILLLAHSRSYSRNLLFCIAVNRVKHDLELLLFGYGTI